ncbi:hypothetical protein ACFW1A_15990 [Kitasatospora sp. NPDC058965]|uniref:hypothetical protein n=1 Tax=Kitasatospora sp. NPDC058965 TaxID=3346682 RepID=UPI0036792E1F
MTTATTAGELLEQAQHALTAATAAAQVLADHPELPVQRMHATGVDADGRPGPFLEIQVDEDVNAVTAWADKLSAPVAVAPFFRRAEHIASATLHGVVVHVTAYTDAVPDDDEGEDEDLYC